MMLRCSAGSAETSRLTSELGQMLLTLLPKQPSKRHISQHSCRIKTFSRPFSWIILERVTCDVDWSATRHLTGDKFLQVADLDWERSCDLPPTSPDLLHLLLEPQTHVGWTSPSSPPPSRCPSTSRQVYQRVSLHSQKPQRRERCLHQSLHFLRPLSLPRCLFQGWTPSIGGWPAAWGWGRRRLPWRNNLPPTFWNNRLLPAFSFLTSVRLNPFECALFICHSIHLLPPQSVLENWERIFTQPKMLSLPRTPYSSKSRCKASFYWIYGPLLSPLQWSLGYWVACEAPGEAHKSAFASLCLATKKIAAAAEAGLTLPPSTLGQGCARHKDTTKYKQQLIKTGQRKTFAVLHQSVTMCKV